MFDFSPYNFRKDQNKQAARRRPRGRSAHHSASPMPYLSGGRRASSVGQGRSDGNEHRPWESIQDIATSSAPARLTREEIIDLYTRVQARGRSGYGRRGLDASPAPQPSAEDLDIDEATCHKFREQYSRLFYAAAASRAKSDRADRERGRGRAGGNRASSNSRSRSRSTSITPLAGRSGSTHASNRRSRSSARSTSPESIFRATVNPINMSGAGTLPAGMAVDDDETEYEVRLVSAPTVLEKRRVWREDVVSGLPFREVWRRLERRANGVMMDDQRVIVVKVSWVWRWCGVIWDRFTGQRTIWVMGCCKIQRMNCRG